jgi:hypothetical protein
MMWLHSVWAVVQCLLGLYELAFCWNIPGWRSFVAVAVWLLVVAALFDDWGSFNDWWQCNALHA